MLYSSDHSPRLAQLPARRRRWTLIRRTRSRPPHPAQRPTARAPEAPGTRGPPPPRAGARCQGARAELREAQPKSGRLRPSLPPPLVAHAGNPSPRLLRLRRSVVAMDSLWNELTFAFSRTSMFPFFDIAHYLVSVMALKHQPGECGAPRTGPLGMPLTARTA